MDVTATGSSSVAVGIVQVAAANPWKVLVTTLLSVGQPLTTGGKLTEIERKHDFPNMNRATVSALTAITFMDCVCF